MADIFNDLSPFGKAFALTALISVAPTLALLLIPFNKGAGIPPGIHKPLLSFAAGGLLGDVFLHSIPHLLGGHDHGHGHGEGHDHDHDHGHGHDEPALLSREAALSHDHDHHDHAGHDHHDHHEEEHHHEEDPHAKGLAVGLAVLAGFLLFFIFEKVIRAQGHTQGHDHYGHMKKIDEDDPPRRVTRASAAAKKAGKGAADAGAESPGKKAGGEEGAGGGGLLSNLQAGGLLNLAADSLHNFTDGVGIGAAFASGETRGLAMGLAVLAHELPHEIGDFAILVQNGCTPRRAILLQFCTAIFAFMGTFVGLYSAHFDDMNETLLALVSGGFVYLATMTVLPEVMESSHGGGGGSALGQLLAEVLAFSTGVALMVAVAKLESHED